MLIFAESEAVCVVVAISIPYSLMDVCVIVVDQI